MMAVRFDYPEQNWSTGTMRKAKGRQLAMDIRRGRPELEEPGIAEAEQLAGASAGLAARGGMPAFAPPKEQAGIQTSPPNPAQVLQETVGVKEAKAKEKTKPSTGQTPQAPGPDWDFHQDLTTVPTDWTHIQKTDGGYFIRRDLMNLSPQELRARGVGNANSP